MITIAEIIGRVNTQLKDTAWLRWPLAELCDYYNDANHVGNDIPNGIFVFLNTLRAALEAYEVPFVAPMGFPLVERLLLPEIIAATAPKS